MKRLTMMAAIAGAAISLPLTTIAKEVPEGDYVCLITFATPEDAQGGANEDALSAIYVSKSDAIAAADASDGSIAWWDYTSDTIATNAAEQEYCLTTFNPDGDDDDAANPNSAKSLAPGQLKKDGETGADYAPGQLKEEGETGKDNAPGQRKKDDASSVQ